MKKIGKELGTENHNSNRRNHTEREITNEAMMWFLKCFLDSIQAKQVVLNLFCRFVLLESKEEVSVLFMFLSSVPSVCQLFRSFLRSSSVRLNSGSFGDDA